MGHQIKTHQIHQAKHPGFGNAKWTANDAVGFFDGQLAVHRLDHGGLNPVDAKTVGNKARLIVARDTGLTQFAIGKIGHHVDHAITGRI